MGIRRIGIGVFLLCLLLHCGCTPKKIHIIDTTSDIRNEVVQSAISLLGKPYRSGSKGPNSFDCSGLVHYIYKKSNIILPVTVAGLLKSGYEMGRGDIRPGDLVFFKIKKDLHTGVMISRREFIHSSKSRGVAVDDVNMAYWKKTLIGFRGVI